jgi:hypothetical protein
MPTRFDGVPHERTIVTASVHIIHTILHNAQHNTMRSERQGDMRQTIYDRQIIFTLRSNVLYSTHGYPEKTEPRQSGYWCDMGEVRGMRWHRAQAGGTHNKFQTRSIQDTFSLS